MAACRNSSKNTRKMNLVPILNRNSPQAYTELELGVPSIPGMLVKYVVHSTKRKKIKKLIYLHTSCPNSN
jgi:hypothetical protein